ncbi:MAG: hypothetical protein U0263_00435 [Polyangiaceae bacterium]
MPAADDFFAQRHTTAETGPLVGLVRTVTATLTSSTARPVIDVFPIPASTNEMGMLHHCLSSLMRAYGRTDLFRLVTYDAGACSKENARAVRNLGLHYLLATKSSQPGARRGHPLGSMAEDGIARLGENRSGLLPQRRIP